MQFKDFPDFLKTISAEPLYVLDPAIPKSKYVPIDLSESNEELYKVDVSSSLRLGEFVNNHIKNHEALVAFGGYLETRNIYKRSSHFNGRAKEERNIHLGLDLWYNAKSSIYTPLDGTVYGFKNNIGYGDYGPTIILKHDLRDVKFYTLYGHLSLESIQGLEVGKFFAKGECIGALGDAIVNGDYPPHLHFQIIKDLKGFENDYPGVCSKKDLRFYMENCPDPRLLLKLYF
ncbi:peptidoglycan DD-metalloendopeptidase family protein [Tamlana sp. 2201CG12-4]|uniref:peptidoglycan DD-metalloendopeptidase family protein n=1 Tax=Tamlana sp. 2201CG12-4 TaxID=3112582 RepID=UPI002DB939E6|nr:peptidoglycan DD-metalloendopeptidase family protein [Tamlana sp. 2201CG12-4]MEC3907321.1 peptidoglycan DD-metalloendopeptidase family protein [Tamlana sp. 2201CG12-4]